MKDELAFDAMPGTTASSFPARETVSSVYKVVHISQLDVSHDCESDAGWAEPRSARNRSSRRSHAVRVVTVRTPIAQDHGVGAVCPVANPTGLVRGLLAAGTVGSGRALTLRCRPRRRLGRG
jgi:hypothetical protein